MDVFEEVKQSTASAWRKPRSGQNTPSVLHFYLEILTHCYVVYLSSTDCDHASCSLKCALTVDVCFTALKALSSFPLIQIYLTD